MENIQSRLSNIDWKTVTDSMNDNGYAIVPAVLSNVQCEGLKDNYNNPAFYRKTVVMERYRFGLGEYKYFDYPLPDLIQAIREHVYPKLVPIANGWMDALNIAQRFPGTFRELQTLCHANNQ